MSVCTRTLLFLVATANLGILSTANADAKSYRKIGADRGVTVEVQKSYQCQGPAPVRISAPSPSWFESQVGQFQRLVGMARIALSFDCPDIHAIEIIGVAGTQQVYQGRADKANEWVIRQAQSKRLTPVQVAEKPKVPNRGELGGIWFGNASCGKGRSHRSKPAEVVITQRKDGSYKGIATITERNGKKTEMPFSASKGKVRRGVQTYNAKGKNAYAQVTSIARVDLLDGAPRHLAIRVKGKCRFISAARLVKIDGLGGEYASWNSPKSLCTGLSSWVRTAQTEQELVNQWKSKYPDFLGRNELKGGIRASVFDDELFRQRFGVSVAELSAKTYRQLVVQTGECAHFRLWADKPFRKVLENTLIGVGSYQHMRKMLIPNEKRVRDYHAGKLVLNPAFTKLQAQAAQNRLRLTQLPETAQAVAQADTLADLKTTAQDTLDKLSLLPPSRLTSVIELASKRREALQSSVESTQSSPTEKLLSRRTTPFFPTDTLKGHTLLSSVFGHGLYVSNAIASGDKCPRQVPVRVQLGSLLPLKHYENRKYGKQFFFYGLKALESICRWPSDDKRGAGWNIRVHYYFDGQKVGQLTIRQRNYSIYPSDAEMKVNGWARNPAHPNYAYDAAFATMVGGVSDRNGQPIRQLTQQDLDNLSKAGDIHAALHMAFGGSGNALMPKGLPAREKKALRRALRGAAYETGTAKADLSLDLSSPPRDADLSQLQDASARGSVAASHLLALDLGLKTGLMRSIRGAKDTPFDQLTKQQQDNFVLWAAKATQGHVYWSVFLNEAIQGWNIDMQAGIDAIAQYGFTAKTLFIKPDTATAANAEMAKIIAAADRGEVVNAPEPAPTDSSPEATEVQRDWTQVALSNYHIQDCVRAASLLTANPTALDGKWTERDGSCLYQTQTQQSGSPTDTAPGMMLRVGQVIDRQCSGDENEQTCDIAYQMVCTIGTPATGTATDGRKLNQDLKPVCDEINAIPIAVFVSFKRKSANRWDVDGDVLKM